MHFEFKPSNKSLLNASIRTPANPLIDFGLSEDFSKHSAQGRGIYEEIAEGGQSIGTPEHVAPEVEDLGNFSPGFADMWSVGIIF